ncbi:MAG: ROK family transcriptional regulator [Sphingomonas hengshuiensis]|uniref:ROK family transcriptional regulator n=2 Tax=Sphingomonas TaxID=13687 RepID=A0A2W4Z8Q5_9SPHN|nr:MAG: ROK family transcriptional regulator [Sphingomonas hengshuiensis]
MARKGTNASGMRRYNQRLILSAIRRLNGASKAELSRVTGLSPQAVVRIIDELDNDGLLFQAEKRTGGMGQPATVYRINGARGYTVGVDIGRNAMTLALLDFDGQRRAVQCDAGAFPTIDLAVARIDRFVQEQLPASLRDPGTFLGIGIAMPWFLGEWRDELGISEHQAREWRRGDVADRLRAGLDGPTFFDNDGNAATLAHLLCGAGVDLQNYLCINLGTFVGGGLVLGGQVVQGRHGNAGALASMPVMAGGRRDSLIHHASLYDRDRATTPAALEGWQRRCSEALAFAISGANSLLDLEAVILDGSLDAPELADIAAAVGRQLDEHAPPDFFAPELRIGTLGQQAAAIGAGLLPLHAQYSPDLSSLFKRA